MNAMLTNEPDVIECATQSELSKTAAALFVEKLKERQSKFTRPLVTLPTGKTPTGMYWALQENYGKQRKIWNNMQFVQLDEIVGRAPHCAGAFHRQITDEFLDPMRIPSALRRMFNGKASDIKLHADEMEYWLQDQMSLQVAVLGLGQNGHVAFNEPGSSFGSRTRVVDIARQTAESIKRNNREKLVAKGVTLGISNLSTAFHTIMLVSGAHKAYALAQTLEGKVSTDVPATYLRTINNVTIIADKPALNG